jgi:hypothetical protein
MSDIEQPTLSIADIANLKQIVEVASSRGAFRADELSQVGNVYDRVCAWLDSMTQATDEETQGDSDA